MSNTDSKATETQTKRIYFADVGKGEVRWARHFAGREGCTRILVTPDSHEGHAAGLYIECPVAVSDAWDAGLRQARAIPRGVPNAEANRMAVEMIEGALNAVARRAS